MTATPRRLPTIWRKTTAASESAILIFCGGTALVHLARAAFLVLLRQTIACDLTCRGEPKPATVRCTHGAEVEVSMRLKGIAFAVSLIAAAGLLAAPAGAAPKNKVAAVEARGHTVFTSRDEDGKTRTRIIIQKRSYLDPGTETFPGENLGNDYARLPTQHATGVLDNTATGGNQSALPGPFTLPFKDNPYLGGMGY